MSDFGEPVAVPVTAEAPVACANPPYSGQILFSRMALLSEVGHTLQISNRDGRDAIVKVRHPSREQTQFSFFVANATTATIEGIPDGPYRFLFAFGGKLDAECMNFAGKHDARQFPGITALRTDVTSTQIITEVLSYTLHAVPSGNVRPTDFPEEVFDRD